MAVLTREQLLARKVAGKTEIVDLGDGSEVVVRGLTRGEAGRVGKIEDEQEVEVTALHLALVEPAMSLDDIRAWQEQDESGVIQRVVDAVQRLSGTAPGQAKDATKSVPGRRRARR
jgi:hypothetical protein